MLDTIAKLTRRTIDALDQPARNPLKKRPPGIALLLVLVTLAILSTAVVEYAYSTRVNVSMSTNKSDKVRSYYLARSAVNLSNLLLSFQYALQDESREAGREGEDDMAQLISQAMRRSNFQMYQYVDLLMKPFNSGKLESPVGGINLRESGVEGFGEFSGEFDVQIEPEEGKIDLNKFAREEPREADIQELCSMVSDTRYDSIFEQKGDSGETLDRATVVARIVDFIDLDQEALDLTAECTIRSTGGDEGRPYARADRDVEPRDAMLTHIDELYQIEGVTEPFMRAFKDQMTVYPVGKPNLNVISAPMFYSVLCRNVEVENRGGLSEDDPTFNLCARNSQVGQQVLLLSLALDGVRQFFSNPMSVLMGYVGSTESKLLPSAKKGQPVAFLNVSQLPQYIEDFKNDPQLMAQFMTYSPTYQQLAATDDSFRMDPQNPQLPNNWDVEFSRTGLLRSASTSTPSIYRITATGTFGSSETVIETVLDFSKTKRRMPDEDDLAQRGVNPEDLANDELLEDESFDENADSEDIFQQALEQAREAMPNGRVLYWREK